MIEADDTVLVIVSHAAMETACCNMIEADDTVLVIVGHAAMETACCNMIEAGDTVLVAEKGLWGMRFADMAQRHGRLFCCKKICNVHFAAPQHCG